MLSPLQQACAARSHINAGQGRVGVSLLTFPHPFPLLGFDTLGLNVLYFQKPTLCRGVSCSEEGRYRVPILGLMVWRWFVASDFSDCLLQMGTESQTSKPEHGL